MMKRREFIAALGSAAAWPLMANAQQAAIRVVGFLSGASRDGTPASSPSGFRQGLAEAPPVARSVFPGGSETRPTPGLACGSAKESPGLSCGAGRGSLVLPGLVTVPGARSLPLAAAHRKAPAARHGIKRRGFLAQRGDGKGAVESARRPSAQRGAYNPISSRQDCWPTPRWAYGSSMPRPRS
jgi:hypothetical protein